MYYDPKKQLHSVIGLGGLEQHAQLGMMINTEIGAKLPKSLIQALRHAFIIL